jgi:cytochrome c oxidase assembly protein subunit 15
MAVPDWPLSFGGLNPAGWWNNWAVRLEHGHRLLAGCVAFSVACLCAALWRNWRALAYALLTAVVATSVGRAVGVEKWVMAHLGIWPAAVAFVGVLLWGRRRVKGEETPGVGELERRLILGAFLLVCVQATLGGLRVTRETAGFFDLAQILRIVHGCVAQAFLMTLVALSVRLSLHASPDLRGQAGFSSLATWAWGAVWAVYCQLIVGASMRHLGVGLAIATFPEADASGSWIPGSRDGYTLLNFSHTRIGALLITCLVVFLIIKTLRVGGRILLLKGLSAVAGAIVVMQVVLGILVVQNQKPPTLTTVHVVMGALLLATLTALAVSVCWRPNGEGGRLG